MSSLTAPPEARCGAPEASPPAQPEPPGAIGTRPSADTLITLGLAAILCAVAFVATGGQRNNQTAPVEIALVLGGGLAIAAAVLWGPRRERISGLAPLGLFAVLTALTALSISWAVNPSDAWLETNRTLAYLMVFAVAMVMANVAPGRWSTVLGAVTLASVVVSAYALATKVFPGALNPDELYARLQEPFGYWNAVGLMAACGVPGCLWLGSRRTGHQALNALAFPALGILFMTIMMCYSRGALVAALAGAAFWLAIVPLRLRAAAVLVAALAGAAAVIGWAFTQDALTDDVVPLDLRESAGLQFGLLLVVVLGLLTMAGLATAFASALIPRSGQQRRRAGIGLLVALALVPIGVAGKLAVSDRGLTGSISHTTERLTDPDAGVPENTPGRFTASGSVRAEYWDEALRIYEDNKGHGVGAGGYATVRPRYSEKLEVRHAHGYVVQTLADLGLLGLAASLALLAAWLATAVRATSLDRRGLKEPFTPERIGLLTLVAVVLVFGVHSAIDWTWFVPGNAVLALLAAGWIAGRGPLRWRPADRRPPDLSAALRDRGRASAAAAIAVLALVTAWTVWQPLRATNTAQDALAALDAGDTGEARELAEKAHDRNPLDVGPLFTLASVETAGGRKNQARSALLRAVRIQPDNADPWLRLAAFELTTLNRPRAALDAVRPALYLDPRNREAADVFLTATRRVGGP